MIKLGTGKEVIRFPTTLFPIEEFSGIYDDLYVRTIIIKGNVDFVLITFDLTSLQDYIIKEIKQTVSRITGIYQSNIWICVTHTFSAPHTRSIMALSKADLEIIEKNKVLCTLLKTALFKAVDQAIKNIEVVKIGFEKGYSNVNVNRDIETSKGWWLGPNEQRPSDKSIPIIRFDNLKNQPRALIYSYDVQSSIMDKSYLKDGTRLITSDLMGSASKYVENQYQENLVAMAIVGAAGDQAPVLTACYNYINCQGKSYTEDLKDEGFVLVKALSRKLGNQIILTNEKIQSQIYSEKIHYQQTIFQCLGQKIATNIQDIGPTHIYNFETDVNHEVKISIFICGPIAIVGLAPELSSISAMTIKEQSPYPLTMILTMVNGGSKYMPDQTAYDLITYEAMNSMFARGTAEALSVYIIKQLNEVKEKQDESRSC